VQKTTSCLLTIATGVLLCMSAFAQNVILGKITDTETNNPLSGATVLIENSMQGTTSDLRGNFKLSNLKTDTYKLKVSFVGYETVLVDLQLHGEPSTQLEIQLKRSTYNADEVVVCATRANGQSAIAFSNVSKADISKQNLGQDLSLLLNFSPSLVTTSDAGAGVGYTGLRIRGTDATRINVTINGIPLNDAESQGVYWVNMPDFASSVSSVQIQRGVGTSTNGAAAFGASVNILTNDFQRNAYSEINNSFGSFNTWKHTVKVGTGLLNNKFTIDARLSKLSSDGFVDRAKSDLRSFYISGGYFGKRSFVRLNVFSGKEQTYQAWEGVPEARLKNDREGVLAYIGRNYLNDRDANNLLNSDGRTYNLYLYDNQTDNYQQDHYQLISSHNLSPNWTLNANAFVVHGRGYYEQFKDEDKLSKYKLPSVVIGTTTIKKSDIIRRRWLDNYFYGTTFSLDYTNFGNLKANLGGGWNQYDGQHFGEIVWARYASTSNIRQHYYESSSLKTDFNLYGKLYYSFTEKLTAFADVQVRKVGYYIKGDDNQQRQQLHDVNYLFVNPKLGLTYSLSDRGTAYLSYSVANREPNRDDFTESNKQIPLNPETLHDIEAGYKFQNNRFAGSIGGYLMNYKNQLVLTGQLNDVGNGIRVNVPESYRAGVEFEAVILLSNKLKWNANATLSQNKIKNFTEYVIDYDDANGGYQTIAHGSSDIAFSPNIIVGSQLIYTASKNLELALLSKYVGQQFLDNTSNKSRQLNAYFTNDIRLIYNYKKLTVSALVNNILNQKYESNGYTYSYIYDKQTTTENFYYPQAGRHFLVSLGLRF
jgi:iron complex outermembrane recepter protein